MKPAYILFLHVKLLKLKSLDHISILYCLSDISFHSYFHLHPFNVTITSIAMPRHHLFVIITLQPTICDTHDCLIISYIVRTLQKSCCNRIGSSKKSLFFENFRHVLVGNLRVQQTDYKSFDFCYYCRFLLPWLLFFVTVGCFCCYLLFLVLPLLFF